MITINEDGTVVHKYLRAPPPDQIKGKKYKLNRWEKARKKKEMKKLPKPKFREWKNITIFKRWRTIHLN